MSPDQTAPMEQSDLGSYWLQYWLTQNTERADVKSSDCRENGYIYHDLSILTRTA